MIQTSAQHLKAENDDLRQRLKAIEDKSQQMQSKFRKDIGDFVSKSKSTMVQLNQQVLTETSEANRILHELTTKYEHSLQRQIELLTENQKLVVDKEQREQVFNKKMDEVTSVYEEKIATLEANLKNNVKKVSRLQGSGIMNGLLRNDRFKEEVKKLGGDVEKIQTGFEVETIQKEILEKDAEINILSQNNKNIDDEVGKTREMIESFQAMLEKMQMEKLTLTKQNLLLLEKLKQAREILSQLLPGAGEDDESG